MSAYMRLLQPYTIMDFEILVWKPAENGENCIKYS